MPQSIPIVRDIRQTDYYGAVVHLNSDAQSFWGVIRRHSLNNLEGLYGGRYIYRAEGHENYKADGEIPSLNEWGTQIWLAENWDSHGNPPPAGGVRLGWETIGQNRLRVVLTSGDYMPGLSLAWNILNTIRHIYPESREQLPDIDRLMEFWAYDETTRKKWREWVQERKESTARSAAYHAERSGMVNRRQMGDMPANDIPSPNAILRDYQILGRGEKKWWEAICAWYTNYTRAGYRFTQKQFADLIGYHVSHVKRELAKWRAEHSDTIPNDTE